MREQGRGMAGALLVLGISFAYTIETWWLAVETSAIHLIGFIAWQAAMTSEVADPVATIETVETREDGDSLRVGVQLDNRREAGLQSVTVGVECGATEQTLEFTHVPTGGYRRASVICPAGTTPETAVETWMEA